MVEANSAYDSNSHSLTTLRRNVKRRIPPAVNSRNYIAQLLERSDSNQAQLAQDLGVRPNVISMVLSGKLKVPAGRVSQIASYLGGDRNYLMVLVITEQYPALTWFVADATIGGTSISADEKALIQLKRQARKFEGKP
jgi:transcriptional regulator with XRE-family HTH domain